MEASHAEVRDWLEALFPPSAPLPGYEVTAESVRALQEVSCWNQRRDSELEALSEVFRRQIEEYDSETESLSALLEPLGLLPTSSSRVKSLVELCLSLGIHDPDKDSIQLALAQRKAQTLMESLYETSWKKEEEGSTTYEAKVLLSQASTYLERLESFPPLSQASDSKKDFLFKKHKEYKALGDKYRKAIVNCSNDMTHSGILRLKEETLSLEKEVKGLKERLEGYHELPPSLEMAEIKVQEARLHIQSLDEDINRNFNL